MTTNQQALRRTLTAWALYVAVCTLSLTVVALDVFVWRP